MLSSFVRCPAKLNLFLSVGPPDEGGYHPLRTVFQAVGLYDELLISASKSDRDVLEVDGFKIPPENTLTKTLRLARELGDVPPLHLKLSKMIPSEAGLGGGSSDAAGLLRWLGRYAPSTYPSHTLRDLAFAIGADVSFFLVGGACRATGYGEVLEALDDEPIRWMVIIKPGVGSSTAESYRALDGEKRAWIDFPANRWALLNDFELVMPAACNSVIEDLVAAGCSQASLTGSGSACFGLVDSPEQGQAIRDELKDLGQGWVVPTLTRAESI